MKLTKIRWGWMGATLVLLLAVAFTLWTARWLSRAERVMGKAGHTSYSRSTTSKSAGTFTVYTSFTTLAGEHKVAGLKVIFRDSYPQGSPVPVVYDPRMPGGSARLDTWVDLWLAPVLLLTWGVWWFVREWRWKKD